MPTHPSPITKKDLKPLKSGRCRCGKKRKPPPPKAPSITLVSWELDPFCSSRCAKIYYGVLQADDPELTNNRQKPTVRSATKDAFQRSSGKFFGKQSLERRKAFLEADA